MPLYMDRHAIDGVTPEALAEAHQKDLEVQHKHGSKYLNYWHDQGRGWRLLFGRSAEQRSGRASASRIPRSACE